MEETKLVNMPGWETVRCIGSGSSGNVYELRKRDEYGGDLHAALKVISIPASTQEYEEMRSTMPEYAMRAKLREKVEEISNEYRLMGVLKGHSNVVSCEDQMIIAHDDDMGWDIYIRMELLTSLPEHMHEHGITGTEVMKLGIDICSALESCKQNGIIHRDIKPQNIFVSKYGVFKLGDFGVAKVSSMGSADKVGTYSYMAPEVFKRKAYNESVDIYSLGMVLYWLLNERRGPFLPLGQTLPTDEQIADAQLRRFRGEAVPAPKNGNQFLKSVVLRACAYSPENRFASPTEMKQALQLAMQGKAWHPPVLGEDELTVREEVRVKERAAAAPVNTVPKPEVRVQPERVQNTKPKYIPKEEPRRAINQAPPKEEKKKSNSAAAVIITLILVLGLLTAVLYKFGDEWFDFGALSRETAEPTESVEPTFEVKSIIISSPSITVKEGMEESLDVSFIPEPTDDTEIKLIWKSSNSSIASVDDSGDVKGITAGTATVRVYVDGQPEIYDECVVTVEKPKAIKLEIVQEAEVQRYSMGDVLDLTGLEVCVYYDNDTEELITDTSLLKAEANLNGLGNQTVKVSYEDVYTEYTVWVGLF